jgi:ESCRT-II complex subunit VPS25
MNWPWQYDFPPFFTRQPNDDTRRKQFDAWTDLIITYCKSNKIHQLNLSDAQSTELFTNKKINRKCSIELIVEIIDYLVKQKRAEWIESHSGSSPRKSKHSSDDNKEKKSCFIFWNTLDEWARIIYDYANKNALTNSVCTFFELIESDDTKNEQFHKIDKHVFRKSLLVLQSQSKAEIFQIEDESEYGVKFF